MIVEGTVEVENPAEVLRDQDGAFKVTSPHGYIFQVSCQKGRNMRVREVGYEESAPLFEVAHHDRFEGSAYEPTARRWQIEKIA